MSNQSLPFNSAHLNTDEVSLLKSCLKKYQEDEIIIANANVMMQSPEIVQLIQTQNKLNQILPLNLENDIIDNLSNFIPALTNQSQQRSNTPNNLPQSDWESKFYDPLILDSVETIESSPQICKKIVAFQNSDVDPRDIPYNLN